VNRAGCCAAGETGCPAHEGLPTGERLAAHADETTARDLWLEWLLPVVGGGLSVAAVIGAVWAVRS
jgi:hypothetical protein